MKIVTIFNSAQVQATQSELHLIVTRSPKELSPYSYLSLPEWYVHNNISATLVALNHHNEVVPGIAKAINVKDDGKTYRFTLDQTRKWSDGSPLKPAEVLLSFTQDERHKNAKFLPRILKKGPIEKAIYLEGDNVLVFRLEAPVPKFLYYLATAEFGIVDVADLRKTRVFSSSTRTSGDYRIIKLTKAELVLEASPYSERISSNNPKRVLFSLLTDQSKIREAIRMGEIDFYEAQSEDILNVGRSSGKYEVLEGGLDNLATLQARSLSKDELTVVKVLSKTLDRNLFTTDSKKEAHRLVAYSMVAEPLEGIRPSVDEFKAKLPTHVKHLMLSLSDEATSDQLKDARVIQEEARKLGIEVAVKYPVKNFRKRWEKENYGLTLTRMGVYAEDEVELLYGYFCAGFEPYNSLKKNVCSEINSAMKPGIDPEAVRHFLHNAYEKLAATGKIVPLYHFPRRFLIRNKWTLKNYNRLSPFPVFARFYGE